VEYLPIVWSAIVRRPGRAIRTFLSIATAFFLFASLQSFNVGIASVVSMTSEAHLIVMSRQNLHARMPMAHALQIKNVPGVTAVAPVNRISGTYQSPRNPILVMERMWMR
jgi:hypothetical protein